MKMAPALWSLLILVASPALALTAVPPGQLQEGRTFDTSSPRSQKMVSILCFGKDKTFCARQKEPPRYFGMGFECHWPMVFAEDVMPDDQPSRRRFMLPAAGLLVGPQTQGQSCTFRVGVSIPDVLPGTKDKEDLMAYVEWEFEIEPIPGLNGRVEGRKVILPYFLVAKRDGSHFKSPWDVRTPKAHTSDVTALPSRVQAKAQKSWMTLIINGQVIDKIEVPLISEPVRWQIYDWRRKERKIYEIRHGTQG